MDSSVKSRIPQTAYRVTTAIFFGIAILTYFCRLYIQLWIHKRFYAEDWVLAAAIAVLVGNTTLNFVSLSRLYAGFEVTMGSVNIELLDEVLKDSPLISRETNAEITLSWVTIFSVKLAYLLFFRKLISRSKYLKLYW